jgi:hypothetical protein
VHTHPKIPVDANDLGTVVVERHPPRRTAALRRTSVRHGSRRCSPAHPRLAANLRLRSRLDDVQSAQVYSIGASWSAAEQGRHPKLALHTANSTPRPRPHCPAWARFPVAEWTARHWVNARRPSPRTLIGADPFDRPAERSHRALRKKALRKKAEWRPPASHHRFRDAGRKVTQLSRLRKIEQSDQPGRERQIAFHFDLSRHE